jgi:cell division initiation protein
MDVTTELLENAAFREAKRGGYNTQDVDEFIEQVKAEYAQHDALIREARQRLTTVEAQLASASRAQGGSSEVEDTLKRTLILAQRTADAAIREAEEHAARTLTAAQDQAARMLAEAEDAAARARAEAETEARQAQEEARTRVLGELSELEAARDQLHSDVDVLERHLEEQRDRIRTTTRELQRLLDDPTGLRETAVPMLSEVAVPPPAPLVPPREPVSPPLQEDHPTVGWAPEPSWPEHEAPPSASAYAEVSPEDDDDAYLAELRRAMTDDTPLGPREQADHDISYESEAEATRSRFGRRR